MAQKTTLQLIYDSLFHQNELGISLEPMVAIWEEMGVEPQALSEYRDRILYQFRNTFSRQVQIMGALNPPHVKSFQMVIKQLYDMK